MATVLWQAPPASEFFREVKPGSLVGGRVGRVDILLLSVSVSGPRAERRVVVGSSLSSSKNSSSLGFSKSHSHAKTPSSVTCKNLEWRRSGVWKSDSIARQVSRGPVDGGESRFRETARSSESHNGGGTSEGSYFLDQAYADDTGDDFFEGYPPPEAVRGVDGKVPNFVQHEEALEEAEERKPGARIQNLPQVEYTSGRPEGIERGRVEGPGSGNLDDDNDGRELQSSNYRRAEGNPMLDRPNEEYFDREILVDGRTHLRYRASRATDQTDRPSVDNNVFEQTKEARGYGQAAQRSTADLPSEQGLQRDRLDSSTSGDQSQRSSRGKSVPYPSELRPHQDTQNFDAVPREALGYDESRRPSVGAVNNRSEEFRSDNLFEIADERQGRALFPRGSMSRNKISSRYYWKESEDVSSRSDFYAKQVIGLETAQSLGLVTQLWVDIEQLKVVAVEMRATLLSGDFERFFLESLIKVGDVLLIHDEEIVPEELNLFNCVDLIGNELLTEDGVYLGKVRDYKFSIGDGALLSIEFDKFGVPLIPSGLVRTYSLPVDEVIEAEEDGLVFQMGAEKRVQKLTKGLFSRSKQPRKGRGSPLRGQRKQPRRLRSSNSSSRTELFAQAGERGGGTVETDIPGYATYREQPFKRTGYPDDTTEMMSVSDGPDNFGRDQAQDVYDKRSFSSDDEDVAFVESTYDSTVPYVGEDLPVRDNPRTSANQPARRPAVGIPPPEMGSGDWDLPIPYRTARQQGRRDAKGKIC